MAHRPPIELLDLLQASLLRNTRQHGECRVWTGPVRGGYGVIRERIDPINLTVAAHHAALIVAGKARPPGAWALHSCDNALCCAEAHLRWGSRAENERDKVARGRHNMHKGTHPSARLTKEKARAIQDDGRASAILAAIYGVHVTTINRIKRGRAWA